MGGWWGGMVDGKLKPPFLLCSGFWEKCVCIYCVCEALICVLMGGVGMSSL